MKINKRILSIALAGSMIYSGSVLAFTDTNDHWAKEEINDLSNKKILNGYEDGSFKPEKLLSREEAAQILSNYIGGTSNIEVPDDSEDRWSTPAIANLLNQKIIKGYEDGSFKPLKEITRAEFATIIYNILDKDNHLKDQTKSFSDINDHWAKDSIKILAGNDIINGYENGTFEPEKTITRAEAAKMIFEVDQKIKPEEDNTDIAKLEEIFKTGRDPIPAIKVGIQQAIIAKEEIPIENIGKIGSWSYPTSLENSNIRVKKEGLIVPFVNPDTKETEELTVPYSKLLNVLTDEFVISLKDQTLIDKINSKSENNKKIALTFDDGPNANTEAVLDVLKAENIKATFYVLGNQVVESPQLVAREIQEGHEIGNHSWDHPSFTTPVAPQTKRLTESEIHQQVLSTDMAVYQASGEFPVTFRAPYWEMDAEAARIVGRPIVRGSLDTLDWENKEEALNKIKAGASDGDIILTHDANQDPDTLKSIIDYLKSEGYEFVTVSEILQYDMQPYSQYNEISDVVNY